MAEKDSLNNPENNAKPSEGVKKMNPKEEEALKQAMGKSKARTDLDDLMEEFAPSPKAKDPRKDMDDLIKEFAPRSTVSPEGVPYINPKLEETLKKSMAAKEDGKNISLPIVSKKDSGRTL